MGYGDRLDKAAATGSPIAQSTASHGKDYVGIHGG